MKNFKISKRNTDQLSEDQVDELYKVYGEMDGKQKKFKGTKREYVTKVSSMIDIWLESNIKNSSNKLEGSGYQEDLAALTQELATLTQDLDKSNTFLQDALKNIKERESVIAGTSVEKTKQSARRVIERDYIPMRDRHVLKIKELTEKIEEVKKKIRELEDRIKSEKLSSSKETFKKMSRLMVLANKQVKESTAVVEASEDYKEMERIFRKTFKLGPEIFEAGPIIRGTLSYPNKKTSTFDETLEQDVPNPFTSKIPKVVSRLEKMGKTSEEKFKTMIDNAVKYKEVVSYLFGNPDPSTIDPTAAKNFFIALPFTKILELTPEGYEDRKVLSQHLSEKLRHALFATKEWTTSTEAAYRSEHFIFWNYFATDLDKANRDVANFKLIGKILSQKQGSDRCDYDFVNYVGDSKGKKTIGSFETHKAKPVQVNLDKILAILYRSMGEDASSRRITYRNPRVIFNVYKSDNNVNDYNVNDPDSVMPFEVAFELNLLKLLNHPRNKSIKEKIELEWETKWKTATPHQKQNMLKKTKPIMDDVADLFKNYYFGSTEVSKAAMIEGVDCINFFITPQIANATDTEEKVRQKSLQNLVSESLDIIGFSKDLLPGFSTDRMPTYKDYAKLYMDPDLTVLRDFYGSKPGNYVFKTFPIGREVVIEPTVPETPAIEAKIKAYKDTDMLKYERLKTDLATKIAAKPVNTPDYRADKNKINAVEKSLGLPITNYPLPKVEFTSVESLTVPQIKMYLTKLFGVTDQTLLKQNKPDLVALVKSKDEYEKKIKAYVPPPPIPVKPANTIVKSDTESGSDTDDDSDSGSVGSGRGKPRKVGKGEFEDELDELDMLEIIVKDLTKKINFLENKGFTKEGKEYIESQIERNVSELEDYTERYSYLKTKHRAINEFIEESIKRGYVPTEKEINKFIEKKLRTMQPTEKLHWIDALKITDDRDEEYGVEEVKEGSEGEEEVKTGEGRICKGKEHLRDLLSISRKEAERRLKNLEIDEKKFAKKLEKAKKVYSKATDEKSRNKALKDVDLYKLKLKSVEEDYDMLIKKTEPETEPPEIAMLVKKIFKTKNDLDFYKEKISLYDDDPSKQEEMRSEIEKREMLLKELEDVRRAFIPKKSVDMSVLMRGDTDEFKDDESSDDESKTGDGKKCFKKVVKYYR